MDRLRCLADMQRVRIGIGIDRDGRDPHAVRGGDDPPGDLAAVGDEELAHRPAHIRNVPKRVASTGWVRLAARLRATTRRVSAGSMTPSSHKRALA